MDKDPRYFKDGEKSDEDSKKDQLENNAHNLPDFFPQSLSINNLFQCESCSFFQHQSVNFETSEIGNNTNNEISSINPIHQDNDSKKENNISKEEDKCEKDKIKNENQIDFNEKKALNIDFKQGNKEFIQEKEFDKNYNFDYDFNSEEKENLIFEDDIIVKEDPDINNSFLIDKDSLATLINAFINVAENGISKESKDKDLNDKNETNFGKKENSKNNILIKLKLTETNKKEIEFNQNEDPKFNIFPKLEENIEIDLNNKKTEKKVENKKTKKDNSLSECGKKLFNIEKINNSFHSRKQNKFGKFEFQNSINIPSKTFIYSTKDTLTSNNISNNSNNLLFGISSEISKLDMSFNKTYINRNHKNNEIFDSFGNLNKTMIDLCNKKRKRKNETKSKREEVEEEIQLNLESKDKSYTNGINIGTKQDLESLLNLNISLKNKTCINNSMINKNENHSLNIFSVTHITDNSNKFKETKDSIKDDEFIKKKRDKVKEKIKNIENGMKKLWDIEKYVYRKFINYLTINKSQIEKENILCLNAPILNNILKKSNTNISTDNVENDEKNSQSYSHEQMKLLFSINGISDIYEKFLKDKSFYANYKSKRKNKYQKAYDLYRKNMHIIYCKKYSETDIDLNKDEP